MKNLLTTKYLAFGIVTTFVFYVVISSCFFDKASAETAEYNCNKIPRSRCPISQDLWGGKPLSKEDIILLNECNKGNGASCSNLGIVFLYNKKPTPFKKASNAAFARGCEFHDAVGCAFAYSSDLFKSGELRSIDGDFEKYTTSCAQNDGAACFLLGFSYQHAFGVDENLAEAVRLYGKSCSLGDAFGCGYAGAHETLGTLGKTDSKKRDELLIKACNLGHHWSCAALSPLYQMKYNQTKNIKFKKLSYKYDKKGCELGNQMGCYSMGLHLANEKSPLYNPKEAIKPLESSCEYGIPHACDLVEEIKQRAQNTLDGTTTR